MEENERVCDLGNPLLKPQQFRMDLGMVASEAGKVTGVVTIRTASTSLTVYPDADQLDAQAKLLHALAAKIRESGGSLVAPNPALIQALNNGRNHR